MRATQRSFDNCKIQSAESFLSTLAAKEAAGSLSEALSECRELRKGMSGERSLGACDSLQ